MMGSNSQNIWNQPLFGGASPATASPTAAPEGDARYGHPVSDRPPTIAPPGGAWDEPLFVTPRSVVAPPASTVDAGLSERAAAVIEALREMEEQNAGRSGADPLAGWDKFQSLVAFAASVELIRTKKRMIYEEHLVGRCSYPDACEKFAETVAAAAGDTGFRSRLSDGGPAAPLNIQGAELCSHMSDIAMHLTLQSVDLQEAQAILTAIDKNGGYSDRAPEIDVDDKLAYGGFKGFEFDTGGIGLSRIYSLYDDGVTDRLHKRSQAVALAEMERERNGAR